MNCNRKLATVLATLFLALTITSTLITVPAFAHTPAWTIPTWCYISTSNNPIGVNQETVIVYWLNSIPPTARGAYGDRWTFSIDVTKPDGSKETLGPFTSDPIGGGWVRYTPTGVGTYSFVAKFPGKVITGEPQPSDPRYQSYINDTYTASESDPLKLIVQSNPIESWPETPLPTQYWSRPIYNANRQWSQIAANWLAGAAQIKGATSNFAYGTAPESAHIIWSNPMWAGGIMDARFSDTGYQTAHYEGLGFTPPIILNGKIYYNTQSLPREGWYCLDLYTGKQDYFFNTTGPITGVSQSSSGRISQQSLAFGQILDIEDPNQHGGFPYLWSTDGPGGTWMMYDAYTSNYICSIANVSSSGTAVYGKDGSILRYNIVGTGNNKRLTVWNTTHAIWWRGTQRQWDEGVDWSQVFESNYYWMWRPGLNVTYDGRHGFSLNVSIPAVQGTIREVIEDKHVIGGTQGYNDDRGVLEGNLWALSLKRGQEGTLLWNITFLPPIGVPNSTWTSGAHQPTMRLTTVDSENGVFLFAEDTTRKRWCYDLATGKQLWESEPEAALNYYGMSSNVYNGMLFGYGYGGVIVAYDIRSGKVLWTYTAAQEGYESPYGNYPIGIACIADGKLYLTSSEHSPTQPLWRGSYLRCINASNGVELWKILNWGMGMGSGSGTFIADGYVVSLNAYDNQIYCYGKGKTATTVSTQDFAAPLKTPVLIKGTITDQSPDTTCLGIPAAGTPAISDDDMSAWMEYLYMQQPEPTNAKGVQVHLTAIDPNGNFQDIGTATSNSLGNYAIEWTPPVPGLYTVTATFEGSKSYYGSKAGTSFVVSEANAASPEIITPTPTATQPFTPASPTPVPTPVSPSPTQAVTPPTSAEPTTTYIAIGGAIVVIIVAAAALVLRRRKQKA